VTTRGSVTGKGRNRGAHGQHKDRAICSSTTTNIETRNKDNTDKDKGQNPDNFLLQLDPIAIISE